MTIKEVISCFEELAPLAYSEDFDNTGLLVGNPSNKVNGILVTLDTLEEVVEEAIENKCNFIVSFHPIIFKGLTSITGKNYVERTVLKAIKNNIAIYALHTALDNSWRGVNAMICEKLGLTQREILIPQESTIKKLISFCPEKDADFIKAALFKAGAGAIGNYNNCSFSTLGTGTYQGNKDSNPKIGKKGEFMQEKEMQIGVTFSKHLEKKVLKALFETHPYEEVAYEITSLENKNQHIGMGMVGFFGKSMNEKDFLKRCKEVFGTGVIKHSKLLGKPIKKVAVLGGSGSFAIKSAKAHGVDAFITADLKYHDFFAAENKLLLADIGHYESEQYTKELLVAYLIKKITNFAPALPGGKIVLSKVNTNPISYY